jgi:branched-chain amino acid transport system permease protein
VVGGLGSIPGAYAAAVIISVVKAWCIGIGEVTVAGVGLSFSKLTLVAEFLVMAVVLIARPWGLFGREPAPHRVAAAAMLPLPAPGPAMRQAIAAGLGVLVLLPLFADRFALVLMTDVTVFALFAASLGLLMGPGGMASFGHAAYFGAGAYAAAIAAKAGTPFVPALLWGIAFAGGLAVVFGWFAVRLAGVSLAMFTLALAQITWAIAFQWDGMTGGSNGIVGVWPPAALGGKATYYLFAVVVLASAILFTWRLAHTPFGYLLRAARDSRLRAEALGVDTRRLQWAAFALSGALAGLAGAVFVFSKGSLSPDALAIPRSMDGLVMVLLGGLETLTGPVIGAALFTLLQDWITRATPYWQAVLGACVIALTVLFPNGIAGTVKRRMAITGWRRP